MLSAAADSLGIFPLLGREVGIQQEAGHANDAIHGGPNLMAHGRQKGRLGFDCCQRLVAGLGQFSRPLTHFSIQGDVDLEQLPGLGFDEPNRDLGRGHGLFKFPLIGPALRLRHLLIAPLEQHHVARKIKDREGFFQLRQNRIEGRAHPPHD